jgi:hypothetical protein
MGENASYKVAIVGCGRRAVQHATGLKQDSRCKVVGLADLNEEAAKGLNLEFGFGANVYGDYKEMLAKEQPDIVISCLWTGLHLPVFRDCAEAGVKAYLSAKADGAYLGGFRGDGPYCGIHRLSLGVLPSTAVFQWQSACSGVDQGGAVRQHRTIGSVFSCPSVGLRDAYLRPGYQLYE